ncbi:uncharacterized protein EI97DRAFT_431307 [Westerdykella ornata]|uniref:NACHT-NTPase and P-loop NTPases N-terminal domain-containing protein n=1 Tax=Westerdykella ornata TaxID=318751 RepID=A0A6A6JSK7_WESOR|nr:uncharacterized protein EI97DRAFT_431307 [Westerdykella ornata]KAF2279093.1 hypothetical protein EI97DRAFT_431307 [Westerdykella ornata]
MAEIFGTALAAAGALEQTIKLIKRIRSARNSPKDLPPVLERHMKTVEETLKIVELIEDQEPLKTENIKSVLLKIQETGKSVTECLQEMNVALEKGGLKNFVHQMRSGSDDLARLDTLMRDLALSKVDLGVSLELVSVGLTYKVGEAIAVNTAVVEDLNSRLKAQLGDQYGLKLATIVQNRKANADGTVSLTAADIAELSAKPHDLESDDFGTHGQKYKKRIIKDNRALRQGFMLNVPVAGEQDIWDHIDEIEISNNLAEDGGTMFNYPVSKEVLLAGLARR